MVKVTNASGTVDQSLAFDAWGLRRNASDWSALGSPFAGSHETERGYTGHEHLDTVGLIHMNGRVQDPVLGRFISADPLIQSPYSTQSHNRYSYVWNNPGSLIDPSGFQTEDAKRLVNAINDGTLDCSQMDCGQLRQFLINWCNSDPTCEDYDQMIVTGSRSGNDNYVPGFGIRRPMVDDSWIGLGGGGGVGWGPMPVNATVDTPRISELAEAGVTVTPESDRMGPAPMEFVDIVVADAEAALLLGQCMTRVCFDHWLGNNGKWVSVYRQPNGFTGPRNSVLSAARESAGVYKGMARGLGFVSYTLEGADFLSAARQRDGLGVLDSIGDFGVMGSTATLGPYGIAAGFAYGLVDNTIGWDSISRGLGLADAACWVTGNC